MHFSVQGSDESKAISKVYFSEQLSSFGQNYTEVRHELPTYTGPV